MKGNAGVPQHAKSRRAGGKALIALGSNQSSRFGDPREIVEKATESIAQELVRNVVRSRLFQTPFFPVGMGADFVNAAVLVETELSAEDLLAVLHRIEAAFGRQRATRWADRTLDLDLVLIDDQVLPDQSTLREWVSLPEDRQRREAPDRLILPHPRLQDRAFVLVPAADLWPDWRHPLTGRSIAEMLAALPEDERAAVVPLAG